VNELIERLHIANRELIGAAKHHAAIAEAAAALEAAREDAESLRRLISRIPRTIVSTQREGSDPMREDWAAFDEVPAYITFDADVVAAIDQARGKAGQEVGK
jgi:hypothetical protein